ncbi:MAG TPA: alkaline phosphatase [Gemmatimonadetes bacterium]|nr:alkaline phosphatase [Gemmatimonadota bacterium]
MIGLLTQACVEQPAEPEVGIGAPKVILIIGDGMDDQQITIARNYLLGSRGRLVLDDLPFRTAARVETIAEDSPNQPVYVADSANSATSMATGVVTSLGRIATTAQTDQDIETIMELAQAAGLGTGIVTTSSVTDATPASFVAHINQRYCEGPTGMVQTIAQLRLSVDCSQDYKASGGKGSIAEQIASSQLDIVLGGGARYFEQSVEGSLQRTVFDEARGNGFQVIRTWEELARIPETGKVLGLFSRGTMPVQLRGVDGAQAQRVERIEGKVSQPEPFDCEPNPDFEGIPSLADMTRAALNRLDNRRGFMLMIESASIDKQSHQRRPCGHIGELGQLDEALKIALNYAEAYPGTLVLVTADHSHAAQIIPDQSAYLALNYTTPGYLARVRTREGGVMSINYATNESPQEVHTGGHVPVFANSPEFGEFTGLIRQSDIFHVSAKYLGLADPTNR